MRALIFIVGILVILGSKNIFAQNSNPKLILQITVDQLRGDFLSRYSDRFTENGFRYFMEKGPGTTMPITLMLIQKQLSVMLRLPLVLIRLSTV